jgi:ABC-2 type transport system permease protein
VRARWRAFAAAWKVASSIAAASLRAELEYRANFLLSVLLGVAWQASVLVFATVLLGSFPGMSGWPRHAVLLLASMRMLSHGLYAIIFDRSEYLPAMIQDGRLEAFLLRPMPVYRQVQLAALPVNALGDLLVGCSMFGWAVAAISLHWTPLRAGFLAGAVAGGVLVEAAIWTTLASFLLRFPATSAWYAWIEELLGTFGNYPLSFLPRLAARAFTFVLPLAFIAWLPAAVLTGRAHGLTVPPVVAAAAPVIGLAAFLCSRLLWTAGLGRWTGVTG